LSEPRSVAFNLVFLVPKVGGGSARYTEELLPAIIQARPGLRVSAYVNRDADALLRAKPWAGEVDWVRLPVHGLSRPWRLLAELAGVPALTARRGPDVLHSLGSVAPPFVPRAANVVTLLDVIWMHHETMSRISTLSMRALGPLSARRADRVVTISEAAREDIAATIGIERAKIDVTHLGVDTAGRPQPVADGELRQRLGLSDAPLILSVGAKRPHKNLLRLIEALPRIASKPDPVLVLAGLATPHEEELRAAAGRLGVGPRVRFLDFVEEPELEGLFASAACFVLPSLQEGFGLPVLEAMSRGVPVACSNTSSLPEVAGDAALTFDPEDVDAIAHAVERLLDDAQLRARLTAAGREQAARFTWRATAEATLASYERALESRARRRTKSHSGR
jgi:glycosyltransferase involved in cell wall biosynthesis